MAAPAFWMQPFPPIPNSAGAAAGGFGLDLGGAIIVSDYEVSAPQSPREPRLRPLWMTSQR